ncbi:MAG: DUF2079 domain-containing protein [Sphaerospermopsis sp.]|nr:DUF2079 domain-containing protein [Sphaerospermopsis sp.]
MTNKLFSNRITVAWMITASAVSLFFCSSIRHFLFQSTALDLALFEQWTYLISQGLPPISSLFGFHVLGDHAALIFYPIALLYKIYPNVHLLFAVQAIALAIGAIPVYALSVQSGLSVVYAQAIALSYLLYPSLFNSNFYTDFRPEAIAIPALLWAMWAGIGGKSWQLAIAVVLTLSCKDTLSLTIVACGIWLLLIQRPRYGLGCIVAGIVWFGVTVGYFVPMLRTGQAGGVVFYASLGSSPAEILQRLITEPSLILTKLFQPDTLFYYLLLVLPVIIGLHWRQGIYAIPALPMLLLNVLSDYPAQRDLIHHYSLPIFPFLIVWLLHSIKYYKKSQKRPWLNQRLLIIWALITFLLLAKYDFFFTRYLTKINRLDSLYTAVNLVQTHDSVLTTAKTAPHLSERQNIQIIHNSKEQKAILQNFQYILIDALDVDKENTPEYLIELVYQLKNKPEFQLTYQQDDVYLFKKQ